MPKDIFAEAEEELEVRLTEEQVIKEAERIIKAARRILERGEVDLSDELLVVLNIDLEGIEALKPRKYRRLSRRIEKHILSNFLRQSILFLNIF